MKAHYKEKWLDIIRSGLRDDNISFKDNDVHWETPLLITVINNNWNSIFSKTWGKLEKTIIAEIREIRNQWAHQHQFDDEDTYRALDSMFRILFAISPSLSKQAAFLKEE